MCMSPPVQVYRYIRTNNQNVTEQDTSARRQMVANGCRGEAEIGKAGGRAVLRCVGDSQSMRERLQEGQSNAQTPERYRIQKKSTTRSDSHHPTRYAPECQVDKYGYMK